MTFKHYAYLASSISSRHYLQTLEFKRGKDSREESHSKSMGWELDDPLSRKSFVSKWPSFFESYPQHGSQKTQLVRLCQRGSQDMKGTNQLHILPKQPTYESYQDHNLNLEVDIRTHFNKHRVITWIIKWLLISEQKKMILPTNARW